MDVDVVGDFRFAEQAAGRAVADLRVRDGHLAADDVGDVILKPFGRRHFRVDQEGVEIFRGIFHGIVFGNGNACRERVFRRQLFAAAAADLEVFDFHVADLVVDGEIDAVESVVDGYWNIAEAAELLPFRREVAFDFQTKPLPWIGVQHDVVDDGR